MDQTPKPINPTLHTATRSGAKVIRLILTIVGTVNAGFFLLIGLAFAGFSYGSLAYSAETQATVTSITESTTDEDGTRYCTVNYTFSATGKQYTGHTTVGTTDACSQQIGSIIGIKYDPKNPTKNSDDNSGTFLFGITMAGIGAVIAVAVILGNVLASMAAKRDDINNDGLFNDRMPATEAQLNVIQSGMRDLGEFWVPRKMTQQEARDVIRDITNRLANK